MALTFSRLSLADTPEICDLLNRTWPVMYGKTGCPVFSQAFIDWLYGGPDAEQHFILGCRDENGGLVGVKAALFRQMSFQGQFHPAFLATHLAISNTLPLGVRLAAASELGKLHALEMDAKNVSLAFFETGKAIARNARRSAEKSGLYLAEIEFQQFVVNRRRLMAQPQDGQISVRPMQRDVAEVLVELRAGHAEDCLTWTPSPAALWHHVNAAPGAVALVAETEGKITGAVGAYVLEWRREEVVSKMMICDWITAATPGDLTALLRAVDGLVEGTGIRGIVVENASGLDESFVTAGGLLKSPRSMIMAIRSKTSLPKTPAAYLGDIK